MTFRISHGLGEALTFALLVAVSAEARAEPPSPAVTTTPVERAIRVNAGPCFDPSAFAGRVRGWLQRDAIDDRITITVEGSTEGEVVIQVRRDGAVVGERRMPTGGLPCERAEALVSLAVAMAIDAAVPPKTVTPASPPSPLPPRPAAGEIRPVAPSKPPNLAPPAWQWQIGLEQRVWTGVLQRPSLGAGPFIALERGLVRVRAATAFAPASEVSLETRDGGAHVSIAAAEADVCAALLEIGSVRAGPCLGLGGGVWSARGHGFAREDASTLGWVFTTGTLAASWRLARHWELEAHAGGLVPLARPALTVTGTGGSAKRESVEPPFGATFGMGLAFAL